MPVAIEPTNLHQHTPVVREVSMRDLREAIEMALVDYRQSWPISVPLALMFSVIGIFLVNAALQARLAVIVFPLVFGFSFVLPALAVGFYQFSRQAEKGGSVSVFEVFNIGWRPLRRVAVLSLLMLGFLMLWMLIAYMVYSWSVGDDIAATEGIFWQQMLGTPAGLKMVLLGCVVGFPIATLVFCTSAVSFPMLLDRDVRPVEAIGISVKAVMQSPTVMAIWAAFIGGSLLLASLPLFLGLAVAFPVLAHASWHLYRRVVL